jgi:predicted membrane-bound mannosyltransferase
MNFRIRNTLLWPWIVSILVAATLLMRFIMLEVWPLMHEESLFAYNAYVYMDTGSYTQPWLRRTASPGR